MTLTDDDVTSFLTLMQASFGAYDAVDAMPDYVPAVTYPRTPGYQPEGDENPYNAWYVKTTVKGAPTGKLAGKTIALKDNICLAGVRLARHRPSARPASAPASGDTGPRPRHHHGARDGRRRDSSARQANLQAERPLAQRRPSSSTAARRGGATTRACSHAQSTSRPSLSCS